MIAPPPNRSGNARLVFLGTPDFAAASLAALIAEGYPPLAVVTQPDRPAGRNKRLRPPPVKVLAEQHGIPVHQPAAVRRGRLAALLAEYNPDVAVVVAYGRILPPTALRTPRLGCVNVHASLLPAYRGAAPIQRALLAGETGTGVSLMQMDDGLDTGPVLAVCRTPVHPDDTAQTLHDRLAEVGARCLVDNLPLLLSGELTATPQDHDRMSLAPPLTKEEGRVDWTQPATEIARRIRGFYPWPGAYSWLGGQRVKLFPPVGTLERRPPEGTPPGTVLEVSKSALVVACGEGALSIREIQEENRKRLPVREFLAGRPVAVGERFGDPASQGGVE